MAPARLFAWRFHAGAPPLDAIAVAILTVAAAAVTVWAPRAALRA